MIQGEVVILIYLFQETGPQKRPFTDGYAFAQNYGVAWVTKKIDVVVENKKSSSIQSQAKLYGEPV